MLVISARITVNPKDTASYIAGAQKILAPTHAEEGCIDYSIAVDIANPNMICIFEQWASEDALMTHLSLPHIAEFLALAASLDVTDMQVMKYEVSSCGPLQLDI
ncbi:putative quinol monooxygenase [Zhongshania aquimaris]|jgi:quinol monooxygenase YgiN|uniref:Antibiotic biosynthesis monooxygenase n=1 Tax=Zhongshania aquimaris TaxID=2857107 RepID=A0ABS6VVQ4_9GAMM|nr:putative quinol monooxygenase [Zhongshania aquimaris]MBW2942435.1 antibiotic biosynthesis monooxygenase [Zhongshania aquimaris]